MRRRVHCHLYWYSGYAKPKSGGLTFKGRRVLDERASWFLFLARDLFSQESLVNGAKHQLLSPAKKLRVGKIRCVSLTVCALLMLCNAFGGSESTLY